MSAVPSEVPSGVPADLRRRVERLMALFPGREDVFALQQRDGAYLPQHRPLTEADVAAHLTGQQTVGVYLLRSDDFVKFAAVDIDVQEQHRAEAVAAAAVDLGLGETQVQIEFSGRKGFHVLFCFAEWLPAVLARQFVQVIASHAGAVVGRPELFPKQGALGDPGDLAGLAGTHGIPAKPAKLGSLLKLPLGVHQVSGQRSRFLRAHIMQAIDREAVESLIEQNRDLLQPSTDFSPPPRIYKEALPCFSPMVTAALREGDGRDEVAFALAILMYRQNFDPTVALAALDSWNSQHTPPLPDPILRKKLEQGYKGSYGLRCDSPLVQRFCAHDACPVYRARQRKGA